MSYTVYGIKNCNTMKKAFQWLQEHHVNYTFHDYKKAGISGQQLQSWLKQKSRDELINKKGLTWRRLPDAEKEKVVDDKTAIALMHEKTSMIKRPLIEKNGKIMLLGFDERQFEKVFGR